MNESLSARGRGDASRLKGDARQMADKGAPIDSAWSPFYTMGRSSLDGTVPVPHQWISQSIPRGD